METTLQIGDRVQCGETDEDFDTGKVIAVDGDQVIVAWDSGVRTMQPAGLLEPIDDEDEEA